MIESARVLIVDDDVEFSRQLSDLLAAEGFVPTAVQGEQEAIEMIQTHTPSAAVIDLVLRDVPGLEILKQIRALSPETECLVLTRHGSQHSAVEAVSLGAHSYWLKPVDARQLLIPVRRAVQKAEADRALKESEEKYRLVVENASEGIALLDCEGNVLEANTSALEILGLTREQMVGRHMTALLSRLGMPHLSVAEEFQSRLQGGEHSPLELTITNGTGPSLTALARTSPIMKDGKPVGLSVVVENITERKKAHEELERLKGFHENIVQSMAEGIVVMDAEGRITYVNPSALAMWGFDEDEWTGKHWTEIIPPDQQHIVQAAAQRGPDGQKASYEVEQLRADGTRFTTLVSASPRFEADKFAGTVVVFTDVTDLQKAQREIGRLSQFQESIIDNANVWLDVADANGNVVIWNKAAERISGYSREEVVGHRKIWGLLYPDDEYHRRIDAHADAVVQRGDVVEDLNTTIRRKDGEFRTVSWHMRNLLDEDGRPVGMIAIARDVTERKQAEEALRESEEKYRNVVERANDGIAIVQDSQLKYVNPGWLSMSGYTAEELTHTPYRAHVWPDDFPSVAQHRQRRLDGEQEPVTYEAGLIHKDGHRLPIEVSAGVITYDGRPAELVIIRDITERKQAEEQISQRAAEREHRLAEMTALYETSLEIVGQLEPPRLMHSILQRAITLLHAQAGAIWLYYPDEEELEVVSEHSVPLSLVGSRLAVGEGLTGKVLQTGQTDAVEDYRLWEGRSAQSYSDVIRAAASAPLKWGDENIGIINVYETDNPRAWEEHDLRLLTLLANQAAAAIKNTRLYEESVRTAKELEALFEASLDLASRLELPDLIRAVVKQSINLLRVDRGGFFLYDQTRGDLELIAAEGPDADPPGTRVLMGEGACGRAAQSSEPIAVTDYLAWEGRPPQFHYPRTFSSLNVPVRRGHRLLGVLYVDSLGSLRQFEQRDLRLATLFANQAAIAIENARLLGTVTEHQNDLRELSAQLIRAQEEERRRISRELHDELGQALTAMSINLAAIKAALPPAANPVILDRLSETNSLVDQTLNQMRDLSLELHPSLLDDLGLVPALRWYTNNYTKRSGVEVFLRVVSFDSRLSPAIETVLFRVAQEALTNVARHAQASTVHIHLERDDHMVTAVIEDDGVGFDLEQSAAPDRPYRGAGLLGIRERLSAHGGTLRIESHPESGTRLIMEIPLAHTT